MWVLPAVVIHRHYCSPVGMTVARHWQGKRSRFVFVNVEYPDLCGTTRIFVPYSFLFAKIRLFLESAKPFSIFLLFFFSQFVHVDNLVTVFIVALVGLLLCREFDFPLEFLVELINEEGYQQ